MSILTEKLPSYVTVDGRRYPVNTDFRIWLRFYELIKKGSADAVCEAISICYKGGELPPSFFESYSALSDFFTCGKSETASKGREKQVFDFSLDAGLIYASFLSDYGIDLTTASMHWHKFLALFSGLSAESAFMRVVAIRSINPSDIKDINQRRAIEKKQRCFALSCGTDGFAESLMKYI